MFALTLTVVTALAAGQVPREPAKPLEVPTQSLPAKAQARSLGEVREMLDKNAGPSEWARAGGTAVVALAQVVNSAADTQLRRERAIAALGVIATPEAIEHLRGWLKDTRAGAALRAEAASALARAVGKVAVADLVPALEGAQGAVLVATAEALAMLGGPEAKTALEERLAKEAEPATREMLQRSLSRMQP